MSDTVAQIIDALHFVACDDREQWVQVGMAIKSELNDAGFDIWDQWSQGDESYNEKDARDVWKSFNGSGVSIRTLFRKAIDGFFPASIKSLKSLKTAISVPAEQAASCPGDGQSWRRRGGLRRSAPAR